MDIGPPHAGLNDTLEAEPVTFVEQTGLVEAHRSVGDLREDAAEDDVPVAQGDDVDADGVGCSGVLADGSRPEAPARPEHQDLEDDDEDDDRHRDRPHGEEHLEQPADERQLDELLGRLATVG